MPDLDTYKLELDAAISSAINNGDFKVIGSTLITRAAIAEIQQTSGGSSSTPVITSVTETTPSVTTSSTNILAANANRKEALIINVGTVDVYLSRGGTATTTKGVVLKAGGSAYEINSSNLYKGAITAIAPSVTSLLVSEGV